MRRHLWSTVAVAVMAILAVGSVPAPKGGPVGGGGGTGQDSQEVAPTPTYRELTPSRKFGRSWRAVVVSRSISRAELVALAEKLHRDDPSASVRFFDDDAKYKEYRLWDENYPDQRYPFPKDWTDRHHLALLNLIQDRAGERWELWAMDGSSHLLPPGSDGQTIAVIK